MAGFAGIRPVTALPTSQKDWGGPFAGHWVSPNGRTGLAQTLQLLGPMSDICPSRDDAQPHIYEPSTGHCRFCAASRGGGKDWRLCARANCQRVKMFHRSVCYQCWQQQKETK